jgi:hypothetical protein
LRRNLSKQAHDVNHHIMAERLSLRRKAIEEKTMNIKMLTAAALTAAAFTTATVDAYALSSVVHQGGGKTVVEAGGNGGGVGRVRIDGGGNTGAGGLPGVQGVKVMPPPGGVNRVVGVRINPPVLPRPVEVDRDHDRDRDRINFGRIVQFDRFVSDYDERCHYVRKFWRIVKVCPDIY